MKSLSIREVRKVLAQLDALVLREGEVVVTRRRQPIARLLPLPSTRQIPSHADLRSSMPRLKHGSETQIRTERDER